MGLGCSARAAEPLRFIVTVVSTAHNRRSTFRLTTCSNPLAAGPPGGIADVVPAWVFMAFWATAWRYKPFPDNDNDRHSGLCYNSSTGGDQ